MSTTTAVIKLQLSPATIPPGYEVACQVTVSGRFGRPVTLTFVDGKKFDVILEDWDGTEVWRRTGGFRYTIDREPVTIAAGETLVFDAELSGNVTASLRFGRHHVTAVLFTDPPLRSAPVQLDIER